MCFFNNCNYNHCDRQTIHSTTQTVISRRESHIETGLELSIIRMITHIILYSLLLTKTNNIQNWTVNSHMKIFRNIVIIFRNMKIFRKIKMFDIFYSYPILWYKYKAVWCLTISDLTFMSVLVSMTFRVFQDTSSVWTRAPTDQQPPLVRRGWI